MFFALIIIRRQLLNKAQDLDRDAYTPSDYCLMGTSMTFDDYAQLSIENHLTSYFKDRFDLDIVYANATYKIDDFYKVSEKFNELNKKKGIILDEVEAELKEVSEQIEHFEDRAGNKGDASEQEAAFTGIVFVVFDKPSDCYKVTNS